MENPRHQDLYSREDNLGMYLGMLVPRTFDPAILVISYLVSLVGAIATLELVNRRTSRHGLYNHLLLFGASISMGGVSIWCMHYIGNRATGLAMGEPELQIAYSIGVTVASFFVPITVLLVAFYVVTLTNSVSLVRIGVSGTLSGGAICGMHYLGNASIKNYKCEYNTGNIVGAAIIAAAASTVALALFFVFRATWTNSWWKRIGCAVVMAGAVSGMHWCAALGTGYRLVEIVPIDEDMRNTTVIVVSCLSVATCVLMAVLAISSARARRGYTSKAQRVTLVAAVFDRYGRILVTPDGLLPSEEVMSTFIQKTQYDVFNTAHPLFHWVYQASRNWSTVSNLTERMMSHLSRLPHHGRNVRTGIDLVDGEGRIVENYDTIFRELFCVAAATLAHKMHERLEDVGTLWNEMFATGGTPIRSSTDESERSGTSDSNNPSQDLEKGMATRQSHGSMMVLVRKLDSNRAVDKVEAAGYRFADLRQVAPIIGSTMQIRTSRLEERLRFMSGHAEPTMLDPGVHVGMFVLRGRADDTGSFDVLVRDHAHNLLPSVQLPMERLEIYCNKFLRHLDGRSFGEIRQWLKDGDLDGMDQNARRFATIFHDAIRHLRASLPDPLLDDARLVAKAVQAPCSCPSPTGPATCSLVTFALLLPMKTVVKSAGYRFISLKFLKVQQMGYPNSPHRAAFARSVHREILPILSSTPSTSARASITPRSRETDKPSTTNWSPFNRLRRGAKGDRDENNLVSASGEHIASSRSSNRGSVASMQLYTIQSGESDLPFDPMKRNFEESIKPYRPRREEQDCTLGGIMISSEVTVDVEVEEHESVTEGTTTPLEEGGSRGMGSRTRSNSNLNMLRQKGHRGLQDENPRGMASDGQGGREHKQGIEMTNVVGNVYGMCSSRVEVKKEGEAVTFVDELLTKCIDTPGWM